MGYVWIVRYDTETEARTTILGTIGEVHLFVVRAAKDGWDYSVERVNLCDEEGMALHKALEEWAPHRK